MNESLKEVHQRPEGKLIEAVLKRSETSRRQLAKAVGLSEGRVRQIINGYKTEGGSVIMIEAPTDTLVRIAEELDIPASDMDAAGRIDVGSTLRERPRAGVTEEGHLWISDNSREIALLQEWIEAKDDVAPPPAEALMLWEVEQLLTAAARKHREEMDFLNSILRVTRNRGNVTPLHSGDAPEPAGPFDEELDNLPDERDDPPTIAGRSLPAAARKKDKD